MSSHRVWRVNEILPCIATSTVSTHIIGAITRRIYWFIYFIYWNKNKKYIYNLELCLHKSDSHSETNHAASNSFLWSCVVKAVKDGQQGGGEPYILNSQRTLMLCTLCVQDVWYVRVCDNSYQKLASFKNFACAFDWVLFIHYKTSMFNIFYWTILSKTGTITTIWQ